MTKGKWIRTEEYKKKLSEVHKGINTWMKGKFVISDKCPDFINTNGEKIAVEVFYKKHKEMWGQAKNIGIEVWKDNRQKIFNEYGWNIVFFDETEVKPEIIISRLGGDLKMERQNEYNLGGKILCRLM